SNTGNINWQASFGGIDNDELTAVFETSDGGYFMGGFSMSGISATKTEPVRGAGSDYWIIKTDANRNIEWQKTIGGDDDDCLATALQTSDGGYLLAGYSKSGISGEKTST